MAMTGRLQIALSFLLAFAVLVIFVSPAVPSPLTTMRSKHSIAPPAILTYLHVASIAQAGVPALFVPLFETLVATHAPDLVDLTSARLC